MLIAYAGGTLLLTERQVQNFLAKIGEPDLNGCRPWTGSRCRDGYGKFNVKPRTIGAHRIAYQLAVGPLSPGYDIDHLCRVRHCVNPAHLEPVTRAENSRRSPIAPSTVNAAKTHCVNGHPLSGDNLMIDRCGHRHCRTCRREAHRRWMSSYPGGESAYRRDWQQRRDAGDISIGRPARETNTRAQYRREWYRKKATRGVSTS
jgi:hypothetical protein